MKVLLSGGGTGGHVTPLRYVAEELKARDAATQIFYVAPRNDGFSTMLEEHTAIKNSKRIFSGKFRRYKNESLTTRLFDFPTNLLNLRDGVYVFIGIAQAYRYLRQTRPDVILLKGGYVVVPVGFAARLLKIPFITHDSDTIAGLANRIVGRWAVVNAVGQKHGKYPYSKNKIRVTGIPINPEFLNTSVSQKDAKKIVGFDVKRPLVFVMGGSTGAAAINTAVFKAAHTLIDAGVQLLVITGKGKGNELESLLDTEDGLAANIRILEFEADPERLLNYYRAADVVIARAGTTSLAELSALGSVSVIIPAAQLGDQYENAQVLDSHQAAVVLTEDLLVENPNILADRVEGLLKSEAKYKKIHKNMQNFTLHDGVEKVCDLITEVQQG